MRDRPRSKRPSAGFTVIELAIVLLIIGILMGLVLAVGIDSVRMAELKATQGLIAKLEVGVRDRLEALNGTKVDFTQAQRYLGAIANPAGGVPPLIAQDPRAQVIARVEYIRDEMPDVWFFQNDQNYPVNFASVPYTQGTPARGIPEDPYTLPLGQALFDNVATPSYGSCPAGWPASAPSYAISGTGIYGASYQARAGILKNLGYAPTGYDAAESNQDTNSLIDEQAEGLMGLAQPQINDIATHLNNHKHITARSEVLYAMLVEGLGPLGSIFRPDDFNSKEVQDTDGDGLPEFVDSWGQPLQFYRWPVYFHSDIQKGSDIYSIYETRQVFPLDPNQELVSPAWWGNYQSGSTPMPPSQQAQIFAQNFVNLFEPNYSTSATLGTLWDRQGVYGLRRSYYTKFLIASSGPDRLSGFYRLNDTFVKNNASSPLNISYLILGDFRPYPGNPYVPGEGWGLRYDPTAPLSLQPGVSADDGTTSLYDAGLDDITSQTFQNPGGGTPQ